MTKTNLIEQIAESAGRSKPAAEQIVEAVLSRARERREG